ncbi:MAG: hypothetical protein QF685_12580 [Verrucomicrobiota bacterium]|jgi:hypothetical protein|nr:hypothetical protein [Verrucomicrobiota bacterium]
MNKSESKAAKKSAKPDEGIRGRRVQIGGGIVLLLALASWLWWPTGESEGGKNFVDGITIDQSVKGAKPLTVLWEPPRLVLDESEKDIDQYDPTLSANKLTLIFVRGRAHPDVGANLYQVRRASATDPWGKPESLSEINTAHNEISPELSLDEQWLFFASNRPDGRGGYDIWISAREGHGWGVPVNAGTKVNTGYNEIDPAWFVQGEPGTFNSGLYFASNRPRPTAAQPEEPHWEGTLRGSELPKPDDYDIFLAQADLKSDKKEADDEKAEEETGSTSPLAVLPLAPTSALALKKAKRLDYVNTSAREGQPALTPRGDYLYFSSNRQETQGNRKNRTDFDLYRARIYPPQSRAPENVGTSINTVGDETDPFLFPGSQGELGLLFSSNRDGDDTIYQLYQSRTGFVVPVAVKKDPPAPATDSGSGFANWFEKYQWWILLLILALLALLWLLKNFLDEEQRRRLSLMQRCLLSSLMLHLLLAFLLSVWVISEAVYKIIKEQTPEIAVQAGQLAQERMALNLREQTTQLPQINASLQAKQIIEQQPVIETRPLQPDIEIEAQQATSQSFAVRPQQVQSSLAKPDTLEAINPKANLEVTQNPEAVLLENANPEAQANRQLTAATQQQQVKPQPQQMAKVEPTQAQNQPVESQPIQQSTAVAKVALPETKKVLTPLEQTQANLNVEQPTQQPETVSLENANPEAQANRQLTAATQQQQVKPQPQQMAKVEPTQAQNQPAENQSTQQPTAVAKKTPVEMKRTLTPLEQAQSKLNLRQPTQSLKATTLEQAQPSEKMSSVKFQQTKSELSLPKAAVQIAQTFPETIATRQVTTRATTVVFQQANVSPTPLPAKLANLQLAKASMKKPIVPSRLPSKNQLETTKAQSTSNRVLVEAKATQSITQAKVVTVPKEEQPPTAPINVVKNKSTPKATIVAKTAQTETEKALKPLQLAVIQPMKVRQPTQSIDYLPLETDVPIQAPKQIMIKAASGLKINPATPSKPVSKPEMVPVLAKVGTKLNLSPNAAQQSAHVLDNSPSESLPSVKTAAELVAQRSAQSVELEQRTEITEASAAKLKLARSNRTATVAVAAKTRAGIPLTAAMPARLTSPMRLQTTTIKNDSAVDLTSKLLDLTGTVEMVELPDVKLNVGINLESDPEHDNPMILRKPKLRLNYIERLGGSEETEKAVRRALDWFTRNQEKAGHWNQRKGHDVAATGMAMLAYMGWGAKHTEPGPYQKPLAKAMEWMLAKEQNGDMRGHGNSDMYDHGIAAIAMAEAYALTKDTRLLQPVNRIVSFTVNAQNPKTGGWRYKPYSKSYRDKGDMSVTGWQIMALKSAQMGGIKVPQTAFQRADQYLKKLRNKGGYSYNGGGPSPTMTAEGMFCRQLLGGFPPSHHRMQESAKYIQGHLPNIKGVTYYYWYYGSLAMHQNQGEPWEKWNEKLRPILLHWQNTRNPKNKVSYGSWDPTGKYGPQAGRCVVTAMATLSLEVYYRYLPLSTPTWTNEGGKKQ